MKYENTFKAIDQILWKEQGCGSELDYLEQKSWMLFLKYLDDLETEREDEAELEGKTYKRLVSGFYRWSQWATPKKKDPQTGKMVLDTVNAMSGDDLVEFVDQKLFPYLKDFQNTATQTDSLEYKIGEIFGELHNKIRSGFNMREIINMIDELHFQSAEDKHEMTVLYESNIQRMGNAGRNGGEYYTPRPLIRSIIKVVDPKIGETVYDPACGSGGMLIEAVHHMHHDNLCCGSIFGQEKNVVNAAIAKMNLFLHGASDFNIMQGDTLRNPKILSGGELATFDCVIANPPFSLKKWGATEWSNDKYGRNIWGTPSDSCGDFAWIQHMIASMARGNSRMAVVMPQGVLFRDDEKSIREKLIKSDLIEAVVTLGDKLFYGTGLSPCFLVLRRLKPAEHSSRILMVDGSKILTARRAQNILTPEDVNELYEFYTGYQDVEDFSKVVTIKDVESKDWNLSPNRYIDYHKEDVRPYSEVLQEFKDALKAVQEAEAAFRNVINS